MPFQAPWRKVTEGDLIYGIHKDPYGAGREAFMKKFKVGQTIDEYPILSDDSKGSNPGDLKDFLQALQDHSKYGSAVGQKGDVNWAVRRKAKGGLHWATRVAKKYVHFVLDGIDVPSVVLKNNQTKNPDRAATTDREKNRSITGAELRWVYRNRLDPQVQEYVQFWFEYQPHVPPWVTYPVFDFQTADFVERDGPSLWAQYHPTHEFAG
jgi:hypothetical protein